MIILAPDTLTYFLTDHASTSLPLTGQATQVGSILAVLDASGQVLSEQRYYPFGETRFTTGTMYTDKLFTDQREMEGLDVYHYGARFYSPALGRFISADTIVPGYANPQNLNRYSYVLNNPLKYTDPTGHWANMTNDPIEELRKNANKHAAERAERNENEREKNKEKKL